MSIEGSFDEVENTPQDSVQLVMIPKEHVGRVLPMILSKLEDVAERSRGRMSVPAMMDQFATGQWQLWIIWDDVAQGPKAVFGTEIYRELSDLWICGVRFLTGEDSGRWLYLVDQLEAWARANGCSRLDIVARKGWAKKLPDYKLTHVLLEKDL